MPEIQINNETLTYDNIVYIDATNGDDTNGDGSKDNSYQTIPKAVDQLSGDNDAIYLKEGEYWPFLDGDIKFSYNLNLIGEGGNTVLKADNDGFKPASEITYNIYNLVIDSSYRFFIYQDSSHNFTLNFYNCSLYDGSSYLFYDMVYWNINLYNCYFKGNENSFRNGASTTPTDLNLYNSIYEDTTTYGNVNINNIETSIYNTSIEYGSHQDSWNTLPSELKNTGTGTNPDGTQTNIGVYGGPYAWGQWIELYHLFNDNGNIKTQDINNKELIDLGTTPTETMFKENGVENIKIKEDVSESRSMTDNGSLGDGKQFSTSVDFSKFESIDNIIVL